MKKLICALLLCSILSSCSAVMPVKQVINLNCSEQDAVCMVNGMRYKLPTYIEVKRNEFVSIKCSKEGDTPVLKTINYHISETGILDAVGTVCCLFPGIGLLTPGVVVVI